jgi:hypothetical protein
MSTENSRRFAFLEEYALTEGHLRALLAGQVRYGWLDQAWAYARLVDEASYADFLHFVHLETLVQNWAEWRGMVRSTSRQRGVDFLVAYLQTTFPDTFGRMRVG